MPHYINGKPVNALDLLLEAAKDDDRVKAALWECIQSGEISKAMRTRKRDDCLRSAAEILGADGCTTWVTAVRLSKAIENFKRPGGKLQRLRRGAMEELSPVERLLHEACLAGGKVPSSDKYLYTLLS
ncbi:hypothetical protein WIT60_05730 [Aquabacterium sp. G14]|uniref:hypothetical protein n=1 Tax=Aquabacterium sp. G14 TaxID=3130164 RepID=UPI0030A8F555